MKKLLFIACILLSVNTFAQDFEYGAKLGLNFSSLYGSDASDYNYRTSFYLGGFANIDLKDKFSLQPELIYSQQGAKVSVADGKVKLNYLNIPLLLKYDLGTSGKLSLVAGPQLGFLLSSKTKSTIGGVSAEIDTKDATKGFDIALCLGVAYSVSDEISVELRTNYGLSKVSETDAKSYNTTIQLGAAYRF